MKSLTGTGSFCAAMAEPLLFHPLKHHLQFIKAFIAENETTETVDVKAALRTIGSSQLDLYVAQLTLTELSQELSSYLQRHGLLNPKAYQEYLMQENQGYQVVTLSDATNWVLRWGEVPGRYVHLHPARYAPNTLRVKANALRTAIGVLLAAKRANIKTVDLAILNTVRTAWLELTPVKSWPQQNGIGKLLYLLK